MADKKLAFFGDRDASPEFWEAVVHTSSLSVQCQLCKRQHFNQIEDEWDGEDLPEYNRLVKQADRDPNRTHAWDGYVRWGTLGGKQAVMGCPCHGAFHWDELFWDHRFIIAGFFTRRAEKIMQTAGMDADAAVKVDQAVHTKLENPCPMCEGAGVQEEEIGGKIERRVCPQCEGSGELDGNRP